MDKLTHYRQCAQQLIQEYADDINASAQKDYAEVILDKDRDHYLLLALDWEDDKYYYYPIIHFDIKNQKIWIQQNNTDRRIAYELVEKGVPKEDIVLGFHSPSHRQLTGFAEG